MINAFHWVHLDEGRHSRNRISDVMIDRHEDVMGCQQLNKIVCVQ
jgi:hypothetical protein